MATGRPYVIRRGSVDPTRLERAACAMLGTVVAGGSWRDPLEAMMPHMAVFGGGLARVRPPMLFGLPTAGLVEVARDITARRTPPLTRLTRVDPTPEQGFVCDQMDEYREARARDPFCRDYIRPRGLTYQASAFLDRTDAGPINLLVFRGPTGAGFDPQDLVAFSRILPYVRAAAMASRSALALGTDRSSLPFEGRGDPVIHVSHDGRVSHFPTDAVGLLAPDVEVVGGRLSARHSGDQTRIDQALTVSLVDRRPTLLTLSIGRRNSLRLLCIPVLGEALDVFDATATLVVVLDVSRAPTVSEPALDVLARSAALTPRERDVARVMAGGRTPRSAAADLGIAYETARLHLKAVYAKLGVHGQGELVALINRMSCD